MHHNAVYLCAAIFALLGLRAGWARRTEILTLIALATSLSAVFFVPIDIPFWDAKVLLVAALFLVAIEAGFLIGIFSAK